MSTRILPRRTARLSLDIEQLNAVEDALAYWLHSTVDNFGMGWADQDDADRAQLRCERSMVAEFAGRLHDARERLEGSPSANHPPDGT